MFDSSKVNQALSIAIASTVRLSVPKSDSLMRCAIDIERFHLHLDSSPELSEMLAQRDHEPSMVRNMMDDASATFLFSTNFETRIFCLTCITLALSGTLNLLLNPQPNESTNYKSKNREWLKHIVWNLYGSQESDCQSIYVSQWDFIQVIEEQIASFLEEKGNQSFDIKSSVISLKERLEHFSSDEEKKMSIDDGYGLITGVQDIAQSPAKSIFSKALLKVALKIADHIVGPVDPELQEFEFEEIVKEPSLHLTIVVSGWLSQDDDQLETWSKLVTHKSVGRVFALRWDAGSKYRILTETLPNVGLSAVSLWKANPFLIGLNTYAMLNRSPFKQATIKAEKTGRALAHFLAQRIFAGCSISLLGFSLGTRVVYYCLKELARIAPKFIHNVYLIGGTVSSSAKNWTVCKKAVAGRLVNVMTDRDLALKYVYRLAKFENPIGVSPIKVDGVENYNLTDIVDGHNDYREKMDVVLDKVYFQP
mmetsp:Transcript_18981/g.34430  ORF Transcript_18981/g.34430 Transcript_18981/m.34430 type:complete len:479 (+) Transcript_18981:5792-7228(+)